MLADFLEKLKKDISFNKHVTNWEIIKKREGKYNNFPEDLDKRIVKSLENKGISKLYSHQYQSFINVRRGKNIVIVTPTASGKTLCYNLPVIQTILEKPDTKAFYLFPTKALSQDQQNELNNITLDGNLPLKIFTYDGDTPSSIRISARSEGKIIITNPDMLHTGILPNHPKWIKILKSLKFVIIDEIHTYRGIFGSHMTNLIKRLKRITEFYGTKVTFICCSATIGNPLQLTQKIIGERAVEISDNGSPSGERHFILYNPPIVDQVQNIRKGVVNVASNLAVKLLREKIKTIVFARSRIRCELIGSYIRKKLENYYTKGHDIEIASYRGGYLPLERRKIEKDLRDGILKGVVSTTALELGIDIGGLDASILAGFPGSISSTWQQAGRAGRRNNISLSILIASSSPIDQFIIKHPQYFFGRSPESAFVDPNNIYILLDQLKCSVFELPFKEEECSDNTVELLSYLENIGLIRYAEGKWYWSNQTYPAEKVSLRTATPENVVIVNTSNNMNQVIGEMDVPSAKMLLFDGAIYLHSGNQYIVTKLDIENNRCFIEDSTANYYTDSIVKTDIKVLIKDKEEISKGLKLVVGDVAVTRVQTKYKKIKYFTHENIGYGEINLPPDEMNTRSVFIVFDEMTDIGKIFNKQAEDKKATIIQKLGNLFKNVAPIFLLCDPRDIGIAERVKDPFTESPTLYIFDNYPGGSGLSEMLSTKIDIVLSSAYDLTKNCSCEWGCPSCIGPLSEKSQIDFNPKTIVLDFFKDLFNNVQY